MDRGFNGKKMKLTAFVFLIVFSLLSLCCGQTFAICEGPPSPAAMLESSLSATCDWVMEVSVMPMPYYLNHQGTKLGRMSRVHLTVRALSNRHGAVQSNDYEELYFSDSTAIGCRSLQRLNLPQGSVGAIMVIDTGTYLNTDAGAAVAAKALTRAYVDIAVNNGVTLSVICPGHALSTIEDGMAALRFFPASKMADTTSNSAIAMIFRSNMNDDEQVLGFYPIDSQ